MISGSPCVFNYKNWVMSYGNWKQLKCVFSFHNLSLKNQRIEWWKQNYGNRVMVVPNGLLAIGPTIFELWVMKTKLWVMEIDDPNTPQPKRTFCVPAVFFFFFLAEMFYFSCEQCIVCTVHRPTTFTFQPLFH